MMGDHRQSEGRMGLPRKPRPPRRLRLAEQTHLAPPFELSHWGKRSSRRAHRALDGQRNSTEQSGAERPRATDRGEPTSTSVPLRISFRALVRASEVPSPSSSSLLFPSSSPLTASRILIVSRTFATTDYEDYSSNTRSGGGGCRSDNKT